MMAKAQMKLALEMLPTQMEFIRARDLTIHPTAQREVVPHWLKELRANLDLNALGVFHAVRYRTVDGTLLTELVDAGHRHRAIMEEGYGDIFVDVKVYTYVKTDAAASELFLGLNRHKAVGSFPKYWNALQAGEPAALGAKAVATRNGLRIQESAADGAINCVTALMKLWSIDAGKTLDKALKTCVSAWGPVISAVDGKLISGIGAVYKTYADKVDQAGLIARLAKFPAGPSALLGRARGQAQLTGTTLTSAVAAIVVDIYDARRSVGRLSQKPILDNRNADAE